MSRVRVPMVVVIAQVTALLFVLVIVGGFTTVSTVIVDGVEVSAELTGNPLLGYTIAGVNWLYAGGWAAVALVVLGGGRLMTRLTRRAAARAA